MTALFVAGAGTDVGKTWVATGLVRAWRAQGRPVRAFKPRARGMPLADDPAFADSDTARLLAAQGLAITPAGVQACSPWRFAAALAPDMAASAEGREVDFPAVARWAAELSATARPEEALLVEGVGGVMSPLAAHATNLDLALALTMPVLLVCGGYLGAISHGLTALAALRGAGLAVQALVVNESPGSTVDLDATVDAFARFVGEVPVRALRRGEAPAPAALGLK